MRLRTFGLISTLVLGLLAGPLPAEAQQAEKVHRIGYLADSRGTREEAFRQGLREFGYTEGQNIVIEWRFGRKNAPKLAAELVRANVDLIVTRGTRATRAAQKATSTIPIVMAGVGSGCCGGAEQQHRKNISEGPGGGQKPSGLRADPGDPSMEGFRQT